ncbi:hypothetical protein QEZ52_00280 [Aliisedimentitalea scapharcae]|uniref:Phage tail tube protein n=1 Tax=Aliisedimentitalea scapharcae TaxID=1524259 RepID=A0ABZ2XSG0_9RHOB
MTDNHIGKTLWMATALPASNDTTGFEALTWVQVKGIQTLPVFGVTHSNTDVPDLATGFTSGTKGAGSGRESQFTTREISGDTGQGNVKTQANDKDGLVSLKIAEGSGTDSGDGPALVTGDAVKYAQGYLHSHEENQGTDNTHKGATCSFKQNNFTVEGTEPA